MDESSLRRGLYRLSVPPAAAGQRLDQFCAAGLDGISRNVARQLIDLGGVHVDGRRTRRCGLILHAGQQVEVHSDGQSLEPFVLTEAHLLYRDRYLLAIDKPAGVATQPTPARFQGTLYAAAQCFLGGLTAELGMVQRLDRDTSGVLVFSIHPRAHQGLTAAFREHRVDKRYLALVSGSPPADAGEIRSQLARRRATNLMVSVAHGGKEAITRYRVLTRFAEAALVEIELLTGRSHQIRAHFAEAGSPLLGDPAYGGPTHCAGAVVSRQMLHAATLALAHPVSGEPLSWQAPLPADFATLLEYLQSRSVNPCHGLPS